MVFSYLYINSSSHLTFITTRYHILNISALYSCTIKIYVKAHILVIKILSIFEIIMDCLLQWKDLHLIFLSLTSFLFNLIFKFSFDHLHFSQLSWSFNILTITVNLNHLLCNWSYIMYHHSKLVIFSWPFSHSSFSTRLTTHLLSHEYATKISK